MKSRLGHRSNEIEHPVDSGPHHDVFRQPEKSLLEEAVGRPLGIGALLILVLAGGVFAANHFMWTLDRVSDYALLAFFVAGGILLAVLLNSGEPRSVRFKPNRQNREALPDEEFVIGGFEEAAPADLTFKPYQRQQGLAEEAPVRAPIPAAATAAKPHAVAVEHDDEVAGYERALLHYAERGDLHGQGEILRRLGHTAKTRGHLSESREFYVNARNCFKDTGDHYAEAAVLLDLGQVLESLGDQEAASVAYRDANRALLDVAMNSSNRDRMIHAQAAD